MSAGADRALVGSTWNATAGGVAAPYRSGFYETAGDVKVFVVAFAFSLVGFFALFRVVHSSRASIRTLGGAAVGSGAWWCPMTMKGGAAICRTASGAEPIHAVATTRVCCCTLAKRSSPCLLLKSGQAMQAALLAASRACCEKACQAFPVCHIRCRITASFRPRPRWPVFYRACRPMRPVSGPSGAAPSPAQSGPGRSVPPAPVNCADRCCLFY